MVKKADIVVIVIFLIFAASFNFILYGLQRDAGGEPEAVVKLNGEVYTRLPLNKDARVEITDGEFLNILEINDGYASMVQADCRDQVCVEYAPVNRAYQQIVCLPHKIVVEIHTTEPADIELDAVAQ